MYKKFYFLMVLITKMQSNRNFNMVWIEKIDINKFNNF